MSTREKESAETVKAVGAGGSARKSTSAQSIAQNTPAFQMLATLAERGARFCRVRPKSKKAIEKGWPDKPYTLDEIWPCIERGENVALLCGHGGLGWLDIDADYNKFCETFLQTTSALVASPTVIRDGIDRARILVHVTGDMPQYKLFKRNGEDTPFFEWLGARRKGELPPSVHPDGDTYQWRNPDKPIVELSPEKLNGIIRQWTGANLHEFEPRPKPITNDDSDPGELLEVERRVRLLIASRLTKKGPKPGYYECPFSHNLNEPKDFLFTLDGPIGGCQGKHNKKANGEKNYWRDLATDLGIDVSQIARDVWRERHAPAPDPHQDVSQPAGETAQTEKLRIRTNHKDLAILTRQAWRAIHASNDPVYLFRFGGLPARINRDDHNNPFITMVDDNRLRHILAEKAVWYKTLQDGERPDFPPLTVVKNVLATPDMDLPILTGLTNSPTLAPSGKLQTEPGYNTETGLYYAPKQGFSIEKIPDCPTGEDIAKAKDLIDELLHDFPFVTQAEKAHTIALALLPFVRAVIDGPTPLHLFEKTTAGTGGTLLANVALYPALGSVLTPMTEGRDDDEWRKRLTASLRNSPEAILIDNLRRRLDSAALASVITARLWKDRVLGTSDTITVPVRAAWVATGNNPSMSNEIARRTVRIRLDAQVSRPWLRPTDSFKHPLPAWAIDNRPRLVWALLTLVKAWVSQNMPKSNRTLGMFEDWARVMGGILESVGIPGFLENLHDFYESTDDESNEWAELTRIWWDKYDTTPIGTSEVLEIVTEHSLGVWIGSKASEHSQKITLGKEIKKQRDRRFRVGETEYQIIFAGTHNRSARWALKRHDMSVMSVNECFPSACSEFDISKDIKDSKNRYTGAGDTQKHSYTHTPGDPKHGKMLLQTAQQRGIDAHIGDGGELVYTGDLSNTDVLEALQQHAHHVKAALVRGEEYE
jgi:hypothetical protein